MIIAVNDDLAEHLISSPPFAVIVKANHFLFKACKFHFFLFVILCVQRTLGLNPGSVGNSLCSVQYDPLNHRGKRFVFGAFGVV